MDKMYLSKRLWLNPKASSDSGALQYEVSIEKGYIDDKYRYLSANLDIWDCNRRISLDFGFDSDKSAKERDKKISLMITALQEIKQALGKAYNDMDFTEEDQD